MSKNISHKSRNPVFNFMFLFPLSVLVIYTIFFFISRDKTLLALDSSAKVLLSMLIPLGLIFVIMLLINFFVKPVKVAKLLGKDSIVKGTALSAAAGIISTGPIYAWYPLLRDLKEKGAGNYSISVFLYNRSVKPFLLPVMVDYFSWLYVITLITLTFLASILIGYSISIFITPDSE